MTSSQSSKKKKDQFIIFGAPLIEADEIDEVALTLKSGWLGTGPKVALFEKEFALYKDAKYAVAVNSCTAALHLSMLASGLGPGDEVITTPMTFCATINAIIHSGATPVLADINPETMNIDPDEIAKKITARTKAIVPVHFAGRPCEMTKMVELAQKKGLIIIEDCAHAIESHHKDTKTGNFGKFGCFSFYVTKNIVTGEGGIILAKTEEDAAKLKILALHGMSKDAWKRYGDEGYKHYYVVECGYKYNMMDIQASIGLHQLRRIERLWQKRKTIWDTYNEAFHNLPIKLPFPPSREMRHAYHLYTILIDEKLSKSDRDTFLNRMTEKGIGVGVHYLSIPEHPYYQKRFGWQPDHYPHAFKIGRQTVSLPISPRLAEEDIYRIIDAVKTSLDK